MSEVNGKPEAPAAPTVPAGTDTQPQQPEQPANPTVEASPEVQAYLKGLGLEGVPVTAELNKVAEAGLKQKSSVSKLSFEKQELLARLASQGKDTTDPEPEKPTEPAPTQPVEPQPKTTTNPGVSDNELFDLARMIQTDFPEIASQGEDGSLFAELRQLGYFTPQGINKKAVYDYLNVKNAQAKELRELREFKEQHSQPDPRMNPAYNPAPGMQFDDNRQMDSQLAHAIVYRGDRNNKRYNEALEFIRKDMLSRS